MKKIYYFVVTFIMLIFLFGCSGYKPIFSISNLNYKISDYSIIGDKALGNQIYSKLHSASTKGVVAGNTKELDLFINMLKIKNETSRDSSGKILEYKITLNAELLIKDKDNGQELINQTFVSSSAYKVQSQYSETLELENQTIDNLINKIYQELLIKLSEKIQ